MDERRLYGIVWSEKVRVGDGAVQCASTHRLSPYIRAKGSRVDEWAFVLTRSHKIGSRFQPEKATGGRCVYSSFPIRMVPLLTEYA